MSFTISVSKDSSIKALTSNLPLGSYIIVSTGSGDFAIDELVIIQDSHVVFISQEHGVACLEWFEVPESIRVKPCNVNITVTL